jgi:hypothetical protein
MTDDMARPATDITLHTALIALLPACMLFSGSAVLFVRRKAVISFVQLLGSTGLLLVVLAHVCEALNLLPWMHWGREHSIGHYLDLVGAVLGLMLFPIGYLLHALTEHRR